jgi:LysM repeat protein
MLTKNIILGSVALTGVFLLSTGCTTSNTIKGSSGSDIPPAEILPMTEVQPFQPETVVIEETTVVKVEPTTTYEVQKGDNLGKIARKFNVGVADLCEINNIQNKNKIFVGQELTIPSFGTVATPRNDTAKSITATGEEYVVKSGDCLSKIASAYGVKTADLAAANKIKDHNSIYVGQKLVIPGATKKPSIDSKPQKPIKPDSVEQAPEINLDEDFMVNEDVEEDITPEQSTTAPVIQEEAIATPVLEPNKHVASETEDLHAVAQMWGCSVEEIAKFNNIPDDTILKKGDVVLIPNVSE